MRVFEAIFSPEMLVPRDFWETPVLGSLEGDPVKGKPKSEWLSELLQSFFQEETAEKDSLAFPLFREEKRLTVAKRFVQENYPHVVQRLEGLRNCRMPEGQETIVKAAFDQAYDTLYEIAKMALGRRIVLPEPYTFGTPNSGVQYEWRRGERQFHLEIMPRKGGSYYGYLLWPSFSLDEGKEGEFEGPLAASPIIKEFLGWVEEGRL